ncbi:DUF523 domain-containing protein [Babesia caballi]|uniref:DUF523 domain-containing protein n=1 Tax=Babesia caballi TaxID=5871 RepID=A0AAV4LQE5_BABCB|nr:DUF523 domain-containing protein [Babesia caballi]
MRERGKVWTAVTLAAGVVKVTGGRLWLEALVETVKVGWGIGACSAVMLYCTILFLLMAVLIQTEKVCCKKRGETVTIWGVPERNFSKFGNGIGE